MGLKKLFFSSKKTEDDKPPTKGVPKAANLTKPAEALPPVADPVAVLLDKLKRGNRQAASLPEDELEEWARSLCIKEDLKECYLNSEFAKTATLFTDLSKASDKANQDAPTSSSSSLFPISSAPVSMESTPAARPLEDVDFNFSELEMEHMAQASRYKNLAQVKVKLVIAEICKSDVQRTLRKMLSPVLTKFDHQQQFGMFHSAIIVGPWYIEWNNSSICIPRKCYSNAAIIAADMSLPGKQSTIPLDTAIEKLVEVITKWNIHHTYDQNKFNCQTFVDEVAQALGFDMTDFEGPLGMFLRKLREQGKCSLEFPITNEMREKFSIKESAVTFNTHKELDEFVKRLLEKDKVFFQNYPGHWMLLKSFDRAFWLRHFKDKDNATFKPINLCEEKDDESSSDGSDVETDSDNGDDHEDKGCPFKDPTATASIQKDWF